LEAGATRWSEPNDESFFWVVCRRDDGTESHACRRILKERLDEQRQPVRVWFAIVIRINKDVPGRCGFAQVAGTSSTFSSVSNVTNPPILSGESFDQLL
jgi:hypothetical protein